MILTLLVCCGCTPRWSPPDPLEAAVAAREAGRLNDSLVLLDSVIEGARGPLLERAWMERARVRDRLGDDEGAVAAWGQAGTLAFQAGRHAVAARAWRAAAFVSLYNLRLGAARAWLDRAEGGLSQLDDPVGQGRLALYRGQLAWQLGDLRGAEAALWRAWALAPDDRAHVANSLALVQSSLGRHAAAAGTLRAVQFGVERRRAVAPGAYGALRLNQGWIALRAGDHASARGHLEAALAVYEALNDVDRVGNAAVNLALVELETGDLAAADAAAARIPATAGGLAGRWQALVRGERALAAGDPAAEHFQAALDGAELDLSLRASTGLARALSATGSAGAAEAWDGALRMARRAAVGAPIRGGLAPFAADQARRVDDAIRFHLAQGRPADAFVAAAGARGWVLQRLTAGLDRRGPAWTERVEAWLEFRAAMRDLERRLELLSGAERAAVVATLADVRGRLTDVFDALHLNTAAPWPPGRWTAKRVAERLGLEADETLLLYRPWGDGWLRFLVSREGVLATSVATPLAGLAAQRGHLYVVDGGWAAARTLNTDATVSYLPYPMPAPERTPARGGTLVVADPTGDLPWAHREATAVEKLVGGKTLRGREATPEALQAHASMRVFHFAGHGVLREADPWAAHLRLARRAPFTTEDLLVWRPRIGLAVLNGCQTGVSQALAHGEPMGLPEALLAGETDAVLAADAVVDDEEAGRFVLDFYRAGGAHRPAWALRQAQAAAHARGEAAASHFRVFGSRHVRR